MDGPSGTANFAGRLVHTVQIFQARRERLSLGLNARHAPNDIDIEHSIAKFFDLRDLSAGSGAKNS
jgi:hypothetical protein